MPPKTQLPVLHAAAIQHAELRVDRYQCSHSDTRHARTRASALSLHSRMPSHEDDNNNGGAGVMEHVATRQDSDSLGVAQRVAPEPLSAETIRERASTGPYCNRTLIILMSATLALSLVALAFGMGALVTSHVSVLDFVESSAASILYNASTAESSHAPLASCSALSSVGCDMPGLQDLASTIIHSTHSLLGTPLSTVLSAMEPFEINTCLYSPNAILPTLQLTLTSRPYPTYQIDMLNIHCPSPALDDHFSFTSRYGALSYVEHIDTGYVSADTIGDGASLKFPIRMSSSNRCHTSALCFLVVVVLLVAISFLLLWVLRSRLRAASAPVERRCYPEALPAPRSFLSIVVDGDASAELAQNDSAYLRWGLNRCRHPSAPDTQDGTPSLTQAQEDSRRERARSSHSPDAAPHCEHASVVPGAQPCDLAGPSSHSTASETVSAESGPVFVDEEAEMTAVVYPFGVAQYAANPNNSCFELPHVFVASAQPQEPPSNAALTREGTTLSAQRETMPNEVAASERCQQKSLADLNSLATAEPAQAASFSAALRPGDDALHPNGENGAASLPLDATIPTTVLARTTRCSSEVDALAKKKLANDLDATANAPDTCDAASDARKHAHHSTISSLTTPLQSPPTVKNSAVSTTPAISTADDAVSPLHRGLTVESRDAVVRQRARLIKRIRVASLAVRQLLMSLATLAAVTGFVLALVAMILCVSGNTSYSASNDALAISTVGMQATVNEYKSARGLYYILAIVTVIVTIATIVLLIITMVKSSRVY